MTVSADLTGFPVVAVVSAGEGEGTHLGRYTMVTPHTSNVFTFEVEGDHIFTAGTATL